MITISFGHDNSVTKTHAEVPTAEAALASNILAFLGAPEGVEPRINGALVSGAIPDGAQIELVTKANNKG